MLLQSSIPLPKIGKPATRALNSIGIYTLDQLSNYSEKEILELHGMGPKALNILKENLKKIGLSFKNL